MASAYSSLPDWLAESLECPVCLDPFKDPPIYLCEKGHGLCQTCRDPLKAQDKPCPVCRGKLLDVRNLAVESMLAKLPKIKCKYEGCTFERWDGELVKTHEDECKEKPVKCEHCKKAVAMSKLYSHLETEHDLDPATYGDLGTEKFYWDYENLWTDGLHPLGKVNNGQEFLLNWKSYDAKATMFWISLCGTPKEAKEYEYTVKIESSADSKAGRTKFLLTGTGECLSCDVSHEEATEVMVFPKDILKKASEGHDEKRLMWRLVIQKK